MVYYGIFTYIWLIFMVNVGKYTIHIHTLDCLGVLQQTIQTLEESVFE